MSEMTAVEALARVEELAQSLTISLPAHIQLRQVIESVRQEEKSSQEPEVAERPRAKTSRTKQ